MRTPRMRRLALVGGTAAALTLAGVGAAYAASAPIVTQNGEAGYGTSAPAGKTITNVQAVVTPNQYGTTVQGGAVGLQLATTPVAGACFAGQLGLVANTAASTYNVEYGAASIGSATEPCPAGGVLDVAPNTGTAHTLLSSVANDDSIWLSLSYVTGHRYCISAPWFGHGHHGHMSYCFNYGHRTGLVLSAENLNAVSPSVTSAFLAGTHNTFTNSSFGISLDSDSALIPATASTAIIEPDTLGSYTSFADQQVAEFDYATVTLDHTSTPLLLDNATLTPSVAYAEQTASPNDVIVAPNGSLLDTSPFPAGSLVAGYLPANVHGASAVGNSFRLFTGNSVG